MSSPNEYNYEVCDADADLSLTENRRTISERQLDAPIENNTEQTEASRPPVDSPLLLSGDVIDGKNSLHSFGLFRESNENANAAGVNMYAQALSLNQPRLPSGQVIDCKNTMQSYDISDRNHGIPGSVRRESKRPPAFNTGGNSVDPGRGAEVTIGDIQAVTFGEIQAVTFGDIQAVAVEDATAMAIVEGQLLTESPRPYKPIWWVIGFFTISIAMVVTGVCASGKCSAETGSPYFAQMSASDTTLRPTKVPTSSPTTSPTLTPLEILKEEAVSLFINKISLLQDEILVDGTTPESKALAWLIREDSLFNSTELLALESKVETEISFRIRQRYPLVTLWYQQTDEDGVFVRNWVETLGWLNSDNECEWIGINCTSYNLSGNVGVQKVVTRIDFFNNETQTGNAFFGTIPPDIGLLTLLTLLDFRSNQVIGSLPESIGRCSLLQSFDVSNCSMTGTLPSSIGKWTDVVYFDVSYNLFRGMLPRFFEQWLDVKYFDVGFNALAGTIPEVGTWTALRGLGLYNSSLNGTIPQALGQWTDLEYLNLGVNALSGTLPVTIGELTNLAVDLTSNNLEGTIPESVGNWINLTFVSFSRNNLDGTIPESVGNWINLTSGGFSSNELVGTIPESVGNWTKLTTVDFSQNNLTGTIPKSVENWSHIKIALFLDNQLNVTVSPQLCSTTDNETAFFC
jgi:hypothetical protein